MKKRVCFDMEKQDGCKRKQVNVTQSVNPNRDGVNKIRNMSAKFIIKSQPNYTIKIIIRRYINKIYYNMSYTQIAQLELLNALKSITSEAELNEFKDLVAHFFAAKAQKEIDAMWDNGTINEDTINQWGAEHMRTPYRYAANRS
jgi:hypothetical protein